MSKQDNKKETNEHTSSSRDESYNNSQSQADNLYQSNQKLYNRAIEQNTQSLEQAFDESRKSIEKNIKEARNQIPRYTESVTDVQEQTIQATKDIAENYLEYQKQAIDSFQTIVTPYVENVNNQLWNSQDYFRRIPEIYSKIANNYAENTIAISRIFNNIAFSNIDMFKNVVNNTKEQSKQIAEIGKRNVTVYERIGKDNQDRLSSGS